MSCEKYQDTIIELFGSEILPDEIKTHLDECEDCQKFYNELNTVSQKIGNDSNFELSPQQVTDSINTIDEKIDRLETSSGKSNIWRVYVPAAAAVFLLVTVSLMTSWLGGPVSDLDNKNDSLIASVEKQILIDLSGDSWNSLLENSGDMEDYYDGMQDADLSEEEFLYLLENLNVGEIL